MHGPNGTALTLPHIDPTYANVWLKLENESSSFARVEAREGVSYQDYLATRGIRGDRWSGLSALKSCWVEVRTP